MQIALYIKRTAILLALNLVMMSSAFASKVLMGPFRGYQASLPSKADTKDAAKSYPIRSFNTALDQEAYLSLSSSMLNSDLKDPSQRHKTDVLIIGGGQAGLAVSYFLRRYNLKYSVLDCEEGSGGTWRHTWESLQLFSPARWSSLPGWTMPPTEEAYPPRKHVLSYFEEYEKRYNIPVKRPVRVISVKKEKDSFIVSTDKGHWESQRVVSATGTWSKPFIPSYGGREHYKGTQIHSAFYKTPEPFRDQRILIVGEGNSGAQILAEVSKVAKTTWVTLKPPLFLPDDVDGRILFERATEKWNALQQGRVVADPQSKLANIVMVPSVKEARARNVLNAFPPFSHFTEKGVVWPDGKRQEFDSVIWCTGFRPALDHLSELGIEESDGKVQVNGTRSLKESHLWLVGYGDWTGFASATIVGVTRTARNTAIEIGETLGYKER